MWQYFFIKKANNKAKYKALIIKSLFSRILTVKTKYKAVTTKIGFRAAIIGTGFNAPIIGAGLWCSSLAIEASRGGRYVRNRAARG